jgi:predicted small metal-binding protein
MPYALNCSDAGQDCPFAVTTNTEDELMQHVAAHRRLLTQIWS